jgi:hypothetical protein
LAYIETWSRIALLLLDTLYEDVGGETGREKSGRQKQVKQSILKPQDRSGDTLVEVEQTIHAGITKNPWAHRIPSRSIASLSP